MKGPSRVRSRLRGTVVSFDDDRGFGFIRVAGRDDVFLHASDIPGGVRPGPGHRVTFEIVDTDRGPRATRVELGGRGLSPAAFAGAALTIAAIGLAAALHYALDAGWIGSALGAINLLTFAVYAWDKRRATRSESNPGSRRVPEAVLIGLAAIGGIFGALAGVFALRHKTRKPGFLVALGLVVLAQSALIVWWRGG